MKPYLIIPLLMKMSFLVAASISELSSYPDFCAQAAKNDEIFADFKRAPQYQSVLEHVSYDQGKDYLKILKNKYPQLLESINKCKENDLLGNPIQFNFGRKIGNVAPTTLRYMKVSGDLTHLFGELKNKNIIEIGGGYGGQCKILSTLTSFAKYTIVDLPEAGLLAEKYLKLLNVDNVFIESSESFVGAPHYDLVISNYAFSEISRDEQIQYIEKILNRSNCGYMTYNFTSDYYGINSLTLNELLDLLKIPNRDIQMLAEDPLTAPDNIIIVWK